MKKNLRPHLITLAVLVLAGHAQAQDGAAVNQVERVVVTGSMIKRTDSETPVPVSVITKDDIERSGASSIDELLRMNPATGAGGLNDMDSGSGFAAGTASISLRGMGSAATLTLVNGRRLAPAAMLDPNSGQSTIFNVNSIPLAAIERIEILKAGASSLYGSDAMAGVVNIIMKRDYRGRLVELGAQQRFDGLFKTHRATAMAGFGDFLNDGFNVFAGLDVQRREGVSIAEAPNRVRQDLYGPLFNRLATDSTSSWPGNLYTYNSGRSGSFRGMMPGCAAENQLPTSATNAALQCKYNLDAAAEQYSSDQSRHAVFARANWALGDVTTLSAELLASRVETDFMDASPARTESLTQWGDALGRPVLFNGLVLPGAHPDNPTRLATAANPVVMRVNSNTYTFSRPTDFGLRYRFVDIAAATRSRADNTRLVLSASSSLAGWDLDAGFLHHVQKNSKVLSGRLSLSGLQRALATGSYRFGGINSPEVLASLAPEVTDEGKAKTTSLDLRGSRALAQLAGGELMLGLGAELRRESFSLRADPLTAAGDIIGRGIGEANGARNVGAAYAELQAPLAKDLETQFALRAERYSDFGNALTGTLGAKYKLSNWAAVRGTYATGFRAPSLSQVSQSAVFAFTTVQDKRLCPVSSSSNDDCSRRISSVIQSNSALDAEKAKTYSLGLLMEPIENMDVVLDAWYVERTGEVDRLTAQQVVDRESEFPGAVVRLPSDDPGKPGQISQVLRQYRNLASSTTGGLDYEASYRWQLAGGQRIKLSFGGSRTLTRKQQTEAGRPIVETLGYYGAPRTKNKLSLSWTGGAWSTTLTGNYAGRFRGHSATSSCAAELTEAGRTDLCVMKPWATVDASIGYKGFKGLKLLASLRNLADSKPPFDPTEDATGIDSSHADPYGRFLSLTASYEF